MQFNFRFTFPEVNDLNDIVVSYNESAITGQSLLFTGPALPKVINKSNFMGWEIRSVYGDLRAKALEPLLTKDNQFSFDVRSISDDQAIYNTTIECKMKWMSTLTMDIRWESFNPEGLVINTSILGEARLGHLILGS